MAQQWNRVDGVVLYDSSGNVLYQSTKDGWISGGPTGPVAQLVRYSGHIGLLTSDGTDRFANVVLDDDYADIDVGNGLGEIHLLITAVGAPAPSLQVIGLPVSDPVIANAIWLDNGVLVVSGAVSNAPTADEKAALDNAPTALTALNAVASVADLPTVPVGGTPALTLGVANAAGSAATFVKTDATLLAFDATNPSTQAFGDSPAVGVATVAAHRDHKHGMPAAPSVPSPASTVTGPDSFGASATAGTAATFSRGDHDHGLPAAPAVPSPASTVTGPPAFGASAVVGTGVAFARNDHIHGLPAAPAASVSWISIAKWGLP